MNSVPRTRAIGRLGVLAVLVTAAVGAPTTAFANEVRVADPLARYASQAPITSAAELDRQDAPGYYRISRAWNAPTQLQRTITVYWMPRGTADRAPKEIKTTPAYQDSLPAEFASSDVVILSPQAIRFQDPGDVSVMSHCYDGWFCLWEHSSWNGDHVRFQSTGYWQHLSNYGFNDRTSSVKNRRNNDSKLSQHIDGNENPGGTIRCYDSNSSVSYVGDGFNDEASGLKNYASDGQC